MPHLFTSAQAKVAAAKSVISRAKRMRDLTQAAERLESIVMSGRLAEQLAMGTPGYIAKRLSRVRAQLDRIDEMMMTEEDPAKLDRLASAQARLSEQERILVGRPLPGSLKPTAAKPSKPSPASSPSEVSEADSTT
jgi:prephenate dehydrogenase